MSTRLTRYVVGPDTEGRSAVLTTELPNVQSKEGFYWRATLWSTPQVPADNAPEGDPTTDLGPRREPFEGGVLWRALEVPPDATDATEHLKVFTALNAEAEQSHAPSAEESARHPTMHRTKTLDCITCVRGEVYLLTDVEEVLLRPGDTVVIRGTNHGWSNRSGEPCLLIGTMVDAKAHG